MQTDARNTTARPRCPVCRFPYRMAGGIRVHHVGATYATRRYGCDDPGVYERPERPQFLR